MEILRSLMENPMEVILLLIISLDLMGLLLIKIHLELHLTGINKEDGIRRLILVMFVIRTKVLLNFRLFLIEIVRRYPMLLTSNLFYLVLLGILVQLVKLPLLLTKHLMLELIASSIIILD